MPLFPLTKDATAANVPVKKGCIDAFIEVGKGKATVGYVSIFTGIFLWISACAAFPLCDRLSSSGESGDVFG